MSERRSYGWIPDLPDQRDHVYRTAGVVLDGLGIELRGTPALPAHVDLRPQCPPVYDQGQLGSCTGNAIAGAIEFERWKQGLARWTPSRLFIYYNERVMEGTVASDSGASIRDGMKSVASQGDTPEEPGFAPASDSWPYDPSQFAVEPWSGCYANAMHYTTYEYLSVSQDVDDMRACLAAGYPFVFGWTVYESFESAAVAATGRVPMPGMFERVVGGHATVAVGYDDPSSVFIVRNSWGSSWGDAGYFYLPYAYLAHPNLADDLWTIRLVH